MEMDFVKSEIMKKKIVAIVRGIGEDRIADTVKALSDGGINVIEITLNREDAVSSISLVNRTFGNNVLLGAGTVVTAQQVEKVYEAGAKFIISPNTDLEVIKKTKELNMVSIPGAFTPTEIMTAYNAGADFVKLFPAGVLGVEYLKAVAAPLDKVPLLVVGGVDVNNIAGFIKAGAKGAGLGGNLVNKKLIQEGKYSEITKLAQEYVKKLEEV